MVITDLFTTDAHYREEKDQQYVDLGLLCHGKPKAHLIA